MRRTLPTDAEVREILSRRRTRPAPRVAPRAGKALTPLIKKLDAQFGRSASALEPLWIEIVGERLARITSPKNIIKGRAGQPGILELRVVSAVALLVQHQSEEILAKVNLFLGEGTVGKLRIAQGPVKPPVKAIERPKRAPKPPPLSAAAEADLAASIASAPDELKAALAKLGRAAMSRPNSQD